MNRKLKYEKNAMEKLGETQKKAVEEREQKSL